MVNQCTLKNTISAKGVGLHTGKLIYLTLKPAPIDTGIIFIRTDIDPAVSIPARVESVGDTRLATTLVKQDVRISTTEHLLAALSGLGIDNLYIEVTGPEVPIMDGSAGPFVFMLQSAGILKQQAPKKFIRLLREVKVEQGDRWASLMPFNGFRLSFTIDFPEPVFAGYPSSAVINLSMTSFIKELSRARTFGRLSEYEMLKANNLALGGNLENAVVVDDYKVINKDGLRYNDEFVRHKILDSVGDLYLLGYNLMAHYQGYKSGHELNNTLLKKLLSEPDAWEYTGCEDLASAPSSYAEL